MVSSRDVSILLVLVTVWRGAVTWQCPAVKEVCGHKCRTHNDCTNKGKCCAFDCVYSCWSLVEYSREMLNCPRHSDVMPTSCYDTCRSDSECPGGRKCCYSECGHTCYPPVKYERVKAVICPASSDPRQFRCDYPCHSDSDCLDMGRCCQFSCGRSCWWSPSEDFITATVMGECTYQENAAEGDLDVRLSCQLKANSSAPMNITWFKGHTPMPNGAGRVHSMEECDDVRCRSVKTHLMFDRVHMEDEGTYMMIVQSGREKYGHAVNLTLFNKPFIEIVPPHTTVKSGDHVDLTCRIINLDRTKPYYKAGIKLKWCHRGLSNADYSGIHTHGFGEETLRLNNVSGDVVIGCGLNSTECTVTAEITVLPNANNGCPVSVDIRRYRWPWTPGGQSRVAPCPTGYSGSATRRCSAVSTWFYPNYYRCVNERILQAGREIGRMRTGELSAGRITPVLATLDTVASELNLTSGDIDGLVGYISEIIIIVKVTRNKLGENGTDSFISIVNKALSMENLQEWEILLKEVVKLNQSTVRSLLKAVSDFGLVTAEDQQFADDPVHLVKETILFGAGKTKSEDLTFPVYGSRRKGGNSRRRRSVFDTPTVTVEKASIDKLLAESGKSEVGWTYAIYTTLDDIINLAQYSHTARSAEGSGRVKVISDIVSVMIESPEGVTLDPPVTARMKMWQAEVESRMKDSELWLCGRFVSMNGSSLGHWSPDGCQLTVNNSDIICQCDKLGNIAVLEKVVERRSLYILVLKICCAVPVLGAFIIAAVKTQRGCCRPSSVLALNMCVCLMLCYGLFAAAVDLTNNKIICSTVAALLHFLFTMTSLSILAQSLHQVIVFNRCLQMYPSSPHPYRGPYVSLIVAVWVVGGCIVAATIGFLSLRGYGTTDLCWITWKKGASFSLLGPAAVILLIHFGFLLYCVCAGHSDYGDGSREEKMVIQTGNLKIYPDGAGAQHQKRKSTLLKQSFRSVYLLLHLLTEIMLVLMTSFNMTDNLLEYLFAGITVLKIVILIYVDAYLEDLESLKASSDCMRVDGNIYEDVLDAK